MAKSYSHSWTPEKLALESRTNVEAISKNASRLGAADLIEMCDNDLKSRPQQKAKRVQRAQSPHSDSDVVGGYHFVCEHDRGVTEIGEGRFWSGSWRVAEINVRNSLRYDAYLALHESRSDMSYRQGKILDFRRSPRDMVPNREVGGESKIEEGIEFLVQQTDVPYTWVGEASGEKGYRWIRIGKPLGSDPPNSKAPS
jgi:hypothetical protein